MGIFSSIKQGLAEAAERQRQAKAAHEERMRPYYRGYDVFPQEMCDYFGGIVRGKLIRGALIKSLILMAGAVGTILLFRYNDAGTVFPFIFIIGIVLFFLFLTILNDVSRLRCFIRGDYDAYGAMVTNTFVESHTSTDSDGDTHTTHDYYVWLNGIKCEVSGSEFGKVKQEQYCFFVRLIGKYIRNDRFYFFPTDTDQQLNRIGQHYPDREPRLRSPSRANFLTSLLIFLGLVGAAAAPMVMLAKNPSNRVPYFWGAGAGVAVFLLGYITRRISVALRDREAIEKKRRMYDGQ